MDPKCSITKGLQGTKCTYCNIDEVMDFQNYPDIRNNHEYCHPCISLALACPVNPL